jgi:molybdate transport system substrate-binding protein
VKPDISTVDAFKQALVAAKSVAYSAGASGIQFEAALASIGIAELVKAKKATPRPGELVGAALERGDAEIGVQQMSELLPFKDIDIIGPLPAELQKEILYGVSALATAKATAAAREFVRFLQSADARPVIEHSGMTPIR